MIFRDACAWPIKKYLVEGQWFRNFIKILIHINIKETLYCRKEMGCYVCGKPAIEPSEYWPGVLICNECKSGDFYHAEEYAYHCETGE